MYVYNSIITSIFNLPSDPTPYSLLPTPKYTITIQPDLILTVINSYQGIAILNDL